MSLFSNASKIAITAISRGLDNVIYVNGVLVDGAFGKAYIEDIDISGYQYSVSYSEEYDIIPTVKQGDPVTVDDDNYKIISIDRDNDKTVVLMLEKYD